MSMWFNIDSEDISIDYDQEEVDINTGCDDSGNIYHSMTFAQIKEIYEKLTKQTTDQRRIS